MKTTPTNNGRSCVSCLHCKVVPRTTLLRCSKEYWRKGYVILNKEKDVDDKEAIVPHNRRIFEQANHCPQYEDMGV